MKYVQNYLPDTHDIEMNTHLVLIDFSPLFRLFNDMHGTRPPAQPS